MKLVKKSFSHCLRFFEFLAFGFVLFRQILKQREASLIFLELHVLRKGSVGYGSIPRLPGLVLTSLLC